MVEMDMIALIRQRNYALLWWSALISGIGNWILLAALPYYVYATTGSTVATGGALISEMIPMVIFSSIGGIYADRWNRKRAMVLSDWLRGALLLPLLAVHSASTVWIVYVTAFAGATVAYFAGPFGNAAIPQAVEKHQLQTANGAFVVGGNLARVIGPGIAGVLMARSGLPGVVLLDVFTFVVSGILVSGVTLRTEIDRGALEAEAAATGIRIAGWQRVLEWLEGLRMIVRERALAGLFTIAIVVCLADSLVGPLLAPFVRHNLGASAQTYGTIVSLRGAGGLVGGLLMGSLSARIAAHHLIAWSQAIIGVVTIGIVLVATVPVTLIGMALSSVFGMFAFVSLQTMLQTGMPDRYRGRLFGTFLRTIALVYLLGTAAASSLAGIIGIRPVMACGGLLIVGSAAITFITLRFDVRREADPVGPVSAPTASARILRGVFRGSGRGA